MLNALRTSLHAVISSDKLDSLALVRVPKDIVRRANRVLGSPICSDEEIERRKNARARLEALRVAPRKTKTSREPMELVLYMEKDRNHRMFERMKITLDTKSIPYKICDVTGDEATLHFVMNKAKCEADDLPIVFAGPDPIGGYSDLVAWDVDGRLHQAVYGEKAPRVGPPS